MITFLQRVIAFAPALLVAACVTVAPHTLSQDTIHNLRIADVEIAGVEVIRSWPEGEENYAKTPGADASIVEQLQTQPVNAFPPVQAFMASELRRIFKSEFDTQFASIFSGQRPVRAVVRLKVFDVPSVARRVFLGGPALFDAQIELKDAKTGAPVLFYSGESASKNLWGGVGAPVAAAIAGDQGRPVIQDYLQHYRMWLLAGAQS